MGVILFISLPKLGKGMVEDEESKGSTHPIKFAVIGDYGTVSEGTKAVANLVNSWTPDFIITTGDNNYPSGEWETIDDNVGLLYSQYIFPYPGKYEQSLVKENRFWPCLGNHDFGKDGKARAYFKYFPALKNQYYYDFVKGPVHFFSLCSDKRCPDGISAASKQVNWLKERIQESKSPWKIVYYHHPTYSSRVLTPPWKQWPSEHLEKNKERKIDLPFSDLGVSAVLSGHLHLYERFTINGIPFITNGLGGDIKYTLHDQHPDPESIVRFAEEDGALQITATDEELSFRFIATSEKIIDQFIIKIFN